MIYLVTIDHHLSYQFDSAEKMEAFVHIVNSPSIKEVGHMDKQKLGASYFIDDAKRVHIAIEILEKPPITKEKYAAYLSEQVKDESHA